MDAQLSQNRFRVYFLWGFLGFVVAAVAFSFIYSLLHAPAKSLLPKLSVVPDFTLVERSGEKIPLSDLKGKVWIADFIFTNCGGSCPIMSSTMSSLQEQLKDRKNILLVSFTVDPERDTPQVLREYADLYKASPSRWLFLTGEKEKIDYLTREGFHLASVKDSTSPAEPIIHSTMFVLVDREGVIRGYYDSSEESVLTKLLDDAKTLAAERS
ncbi:MAG TPA: SCO family protein [Bacteroidota bacterium]|nr:SCO family protein [Bacteroidota bacterium]